LAITAGPNNRGRFCRQLAFSEFRFYYTAIL
jgi:hypothetical protein